MMAKPPLTKSIILMSNLNYVNELWLAIEKFYRRMLFGLVVWNAGNTKMKLKPQLS